MCPVCFYDNMPNAPQDYHICPCCGTEFGNDDQERTHEQLRQFWISTGAKWFFREPPPLWNPWLQLSLAGARLPYSSCTMTFTTVISSSRSVRQGHTSRSQSIFPCDDCTELAEAA